MLTQKEVMSTGRLQNAEKCIIQNIATHYSHDKETVMPSLQVRDLPEPLYRKLQINARKDQRSLSQQAIVTLKKGLDLKDDLKDRRRKLLERIAETSADIATDRYEDPVKMIREDRER